MKIAFVIINANRHEGTSRAVLEVAERLASSHEVHLFARTVLDANLDRIQWHSIPGVHRPEVADFQSFKMLVDWRLASEKFDIVHSAGPNTRHADVYTIQTVHTIKMREIAAARARDSARLLRRLSWYLYDNAVLRAEKQAYLPYRNALGKRRARAFLPVSQGTKQELLDCYPNCQNAVVETIPNGADLLKFNPAKRNQARAQLEREFSFKPSDFIVLFSGGDWRRKGLDVAIQALAQLTDTNIKLLVAGNDRSGNDVRQLANELGVSDRVTFAGFRNDVDMFYAGSDLFLFPTVYEAFSLATIEAAASGLPVLMSDVSGAAELVGSGEAGELIPREPAAIARLVQHYALDPQLRAGKSRQARQLVEREFSWDTIADRTLRVYEQVLAAAE